MVTLECDSCDKTQEFPDTLTVVTEDISGWALEVSEMDSGLRVESMYCEDCH